jgi:cation diffusion facilitator CzcD-associated flavoprotein CzcO
MASQTHYDAVIIGAGFSGLRALYEMRKRGLGARAFEAGSGIGGVRLRARVETGKLLLTCHVDLVLEPLSWRPHRQ